MGTSDMGHRPTFIPPRRLDAAYEVPRFFEKKRKCMTTALFVERSLRHPTKVWAGVLGRGHTRERSISQDCDEFLIIECLKSPRLCSLTQITYPCGTTHFAVSPRDGRISRSEKAPHGVAGRDEWPFVCDDTALRDDRACFQVDLDHA